MNTSNRFHRQKGFTLIEILLALTVIAALAVAAFIVYPRVQATKDATNELKIITAAQANIKAIWSSGIYNTMTPAAVGLGDIFPKYMNAVPGSSSLRNRWEGQIRVIYSKSNGEIPLDIGAGGKARYFQIRYQRVPKAVCTLMVGEASQIFGTILVGKNPNSPTAPDDIVQDLYSTTEVPLDAAKVSENCKGTNGTASIIFVSK